MASSICWKCNNTCGGCSWTREYRPVPGWQADEKIIKSSKGKIVKSYIVKKCPDFEPLKRCNNDLLIFYKILFDKGGGNNVCSHKH